jgi:O-antigen/teichoic acid export membrane protein
LKASKYVVFITLTAFIPLIVLSEPILRLWVGSDMALEATAIMMLLGVAFLIRSQSSIPTVVNLGIGRPQVNAMFSFANLVIVAVFIYPAITMYGLLGVAVLSVLSSLNAPLFIYVTNRNVLLHGNRDYLTKVIFRPALVGSLQCGFVLTFNDVTSAVGVLTLIVTSVVLSGILSWFFNVIEADDKRYARAKVSAFLKRALQRPPAVTPRPHKHELR